MEAHHSEFILFFFPKLTEREKKIGYPASPPCNMLQSNVYFNKATTCLTNLLQRHCSLVYEMWQDAQPVGLHTDRIV